MISRNYLQFIFNSTICKIFREINSNLLHSNMEYFRKCTNFSSICWNWTYEFPNMKCTFTIFFDFFRHQWTFSLCTCQEIPFQSFRLQWWLWWWLDQSKLCSTLIQLSKLWITLVEVRRLLINSAVCLQFLFSVDLELFPYTQCGKTRNPMPRNFFRKVDLEFFSKNKKTDFTKFLRFSAKFLWNKLFRK